MLLKSSVIRKIILILGCISSTCVYSFDSRSTGADGALTPATDVTLTLPIDGIFNYTEVNIPVGVKVTFQNNAANSPVVWLVQGDVLIDGIVDLSAGPSSIAGPGGFRGGLGGIGNPDVVANPLVAAGGGGQGPGGGAPAVGYLTTSSFFFISGCSAGAGGYLNNGGSKLDNFCRETVSGANVGGSSYGRDNLIPLLGGSGGGGGAGGKTGNGSSGGGGGGAILIAVSGTLTINGSILTNGATSLDVGSSTGGGGCGGGGSGGAIRLTATTISGNGIISANHTGVNCIGSQNSRTFAAAGSVGRVRLEAENLIRTASSIPAYSFDVPQALFVPNFPQLSITNIGGIAVPANPIGVNDVILPVNTLNPIDIQFATIDIPIGATISLRISPLLGAETILTSGPTAGTLAAGSALVSADIPTGTSSMIASVEFVVDAQASIDYAPYAGGQLVARIRASYDPQKGSLTTFITQKGDEFEWPSSVLGIN